MSLPRRIAVTGNIGSGKTTVCRQCERLGLPVYYADERARALMTEDAELVAALRAAFGPATYRPDGSLDRAYLAGVAFGDPDRLAALNALVHPAVHRDADAWHRSQLASGAPYTLYEAAITLEIGAADRFAGVVVVAAPYALRRVRVLARGGITAAEFDRRAARQWPDERKEAAADFLVRNDGRRLLLPQVLGLHRWASGSSGPR